MLKPLPGFEPGLTPYEGDTLPLRYRGKKSEAKDLNHLLRLKDNINLFLDYMYFKHENPWDLFIFSFLSRVSKIVN